MTDTLTSVDIHVIVRIDGTVIEIYEGVSLKENILNFLFFGRFVKKLFTLRK